MLFFAQEGSLMTFSDLLDSNVNLCQAQRSFLQQSQGIKGVKRWNLWNLPVDCEFEHVFDLCTSRSIEGHIWNYQHTLLEII